MSDHKLRLALLDARTRRMVRHTSDPVERALALVVISRAVADNAAVAASARTNTGSLGIRGTEQVLTAALEHLHAIRRAVHHNRQTDAHDD
ncbi:hypothetical protein [Curtobacterium sp. 1544]|uniref:hypothetical protein n=1 Tax=Curtobacterium sp. 1544 TaxID=3156417 RepID=UPI003399BDEA